LLISLLSISAVNVLDIFEYIINLATDRALRCLWINCTIRFP